MNIKGYILFFVVLSLCVFDGTAQIKPGLEGLKNNREYMELLEKGQKLTLKQDSLAQIIEVKKANFQNSEITDEQKLDLTNEILNLESGLFDIRSEQGLINSKTSAIEQDFILANMINNNTPSQEENTAVSDDSTTDVLQSDKVQLELTKSELLQLSRLKEADKNISVAFDSIKVYKERLDTIKKYYLQTADIITGDSLLAEFKSTSSTISATDFNSTKLWNEIYTFEIELYNRLLDKFLAPSEVIEQLNEKSRNTRSQESTLELQYIAPSISKSIRQKLLVMDYEKELARVLNLDAALESIDKKKSSIQVDAYDIDKISIPVQDFVLYQDIKRTKSDSHSKDKPIKELVIPTRGELHKVELFTYTTPPTNFATFKYISPIEKQKLPNGKTRYWAGSFETAKQAENESKTLNKLGLKTSVASWKDGVNLTDYTLNLGQFEVTFKNYTTTIKEMLQANFPNITTQSDEDANGSTLYKVGPFNTRKEATMAASFIGEEAEILIIYDI
ncbi:MAG: hypothetical protein R3Y04_00850 [Rikenellaceae bacterium]